MTATDLTLTIVQMLRKKGVVDKFVEFYGAGLSNITLADCATIANMAPEYGATMGYFPIDAHSIEYLRRTGRSETLCALVERYAKAQGLFRTDETPDPIFTDTLALDLAAVEPSMVGPKRPQDRVPLSQAKTVFRAALTAQDGRVSRPGGARRGGRRRSRGSSRIAPACARLKRCGVAKAGCLAAARGFG